MVQTLLYMVQTIALKNNHNQKNISTKQMQGKKHTKIKQIKVKKLKWKS